MTADRAIECDGLSRRFGKFVAVDNLSFDVRRGEVFGFLGSNGAGKSTTIRMLCGLLSPTSGRASVGGIDVGRDPEGVKRRIGYMSQRFSLYELLTVDQNIRFYAGLYGLDRARLERRRTFALEMAGLTGRENQLARDLAGGWRQRLALGCALLHEPPIVFLDEPTGGVDPISRRDFWRLIDDLSSAGTTVLVTTHYLDEAERCDRVAIIHAGQLAAIGTNAELKASFADRPIVEVRSPDPVAAMRVLDETVVRREDEPLRDDRPRGPAKPRVGRGRPAGRAGTCGRGGDVDPAGVAVPRRRLPRRRRQGGIDEGGMKRAWAVSLKEMRQIMRDRRTLLILLFIPAFFLFLYGYALNFDIRHVALAVQDRDGTPESRELVARFTSSTYFDIVAAVVFGCGCRRPHGPRDGARGTGHSRRLCAPDSAA